MEGSPPLLSDRVARQRLIASALRYLYFAIGSCAASVSVTSHRLVRIISLAS